MKLRRYFVSYFYTIEDTSGFGFGHIFANVTERIKDPETLAPITRMLEEAHPDRTFIILSFQEVESESSVD